MSIPDSPVRIAFCITDLDPGGAERALVQLVGRLDRSRWRPVVFCLAGEGALAEDLRASDVPVTCLGATRWTNVGALWRLVQALRRFQPALIQTFLFHANLGGRIAARLAGVGKVVSGIRVAEKRSRIPLWLDRWTNWLVDANVCVSQAVAEFSVNQARLAPGKIVVIPNGVDVSRFAAAAKIDLAQFGIPADSRTFLTIGRLDPQKGLTTLVEAAALVVKKYPQAHFLLVGEGPERTPLADLIVAKGLERHVHLAGWRPDVPELLASGDALVLSSLWEGMPNVVLEGMAAGLPVVATRVEGISELVREAQTGLVVPPRSPHDLAAAIEKLLNDPNVAKTMGHAGQDLARAEFPWKKTARAYEHLYARLLGLPSEPSHDEFPGP